MKLTLSLLILVCACSQAQVETDVIQKASEAIKKLKSVKYDVTEINRHANISADITLTRDKSYPLFGVSKIKVIGLAMTDHGNEQIQFTSNGNTFQYYDLVQNKVIVENRERREMAHIANLIIHVSTTSRGW